MSLQTSGCGQRNRCTIVVECLRSSLDKKTADMKPAVFKMVGPVRFELTTSCTPCKRATRLRYGPKQENGDKAVYWRQ